MTSWFWNQAPPPPPPTFLEEWSEDILWATGWFGFCLSLLCTQMPTALSMAIVQALNNATFCIQYGLLGAWGGLSTQIIACTNALLKIGVEGGGSGLCKTLQRVMPFLLIPLGAYTYSKPLDLLPLSAAAGRLVSYQMQDMYAMRRLQLVALTPWVPYAIALGQSSSLLTAVVAIVLQAIALWSNHSAQILGRGKEAVAASKSE